MSVVYKFSKHADGMHLKMNSSVAGLLSERRPLLVCACLQDLPVKCCLLQWQDPAAAADLHPDVVLGADILYDPSECLV